MRDLVQSLLQTLTRLALPLSLLLFVISIATRILYYANASGIAISERELVGGDFIAFWSAGLAVWAGEAAQHYDAAHFEQALSIHTDLERHFMLWQYPPTMFFFVAPLGLMSFMGAYWFWMIASWALMVAALRAISLTWRETLILACASLTPFVFDSGQSAFFTTALVITALFGARAKPVRAGIAAGLLTIKPQFGVLLPLVYAVSNAWRAFAIAAVTAILLAMGATVAFGAGIWVDFYLSMTRLYSDFTQGGYAAPPRHMTTLLSQFLLLGVDRSLAAGVHYVFAALIVAINIFAWRFDAAPHLRAGLTCSSILLVTPYAYSYELIVLIGAAAALILAARTRGWLAFEREALLVGWIIAASYDYIGLENTIQVPFWLTLAAFSLVLRRVLLEPKIAALTARFSRRVAPA